MGKRDRIVALAVLEDRLKQQLLDVQAELDELLSNRKRPRRKKDGSGTRAGKPTLTAQQKEEVVAAGPLPQRVLSLLRFFPEKELSVTEIAELIEAGNENSVRGVLSRLKTSGAVRSGVRGRYSIAKAAS